MSKVIEISGVSKSYFSGSISAYQTLRETLVNLVFSRKSKKNIFNALNDISLDVFAGDRVAIMGNNGAGKSTLLKIISGITPPTEGGITIKGRISSLLEVGTGFHPELSGRENIYLNGSILGMRRKEIEKYFDQIVEFSGVGAFIDEPIKKYSSGMAARLGFAVASHLQADILIVDEVLAVGDIAFQAKCLGKMTDISAENGKTILFVSHNIQAMKQLCNKGVYLDKGCVLASGEINDVIQKYIKHSSSTSNYYFRNKHIGFELIEFSGRKDISPGDSIQFALSFTLDSSYNDCYVDLCVYTKTQYDIFHTFGRNQNNVFSINAGPNTANVVIENINLNIGDYYLNFYMASEGGVVIADIMDIPLFRIINAPAEISSASQIVLNSSVEVRKND
jgi:lipopolysaccharide transport system ATP-binding protein